MNWKIVQRSASDPALLRFLLCAGAGILASSVMAVVLGGGVLWSVAIVLLCGCAGGLVAAVRGRED